MECHRNLHTQLKRCLVFFAYFIVFDMSVIADTYTCPEKYCEAGYYVFGGECEKCNDVFISAHGYDSFKNYCASHTSKYTIKYDNILPLRECNEYVSYKIQKCDGDQIANENYSGCMDDKTSEYTECEDPTGIIAGTPVRNCKAGYFLPRNSQKCCKCSDKNLNKAGLSYDVKFAACINPSCSAHISDKSQCVYKCPEGTEPDKNHKTCESIRKFVCGAGTSVNIDLNTKKLQNSFTLKAGLYVKKLRDIDLTETLVDICGSCADSTVNNNQYCPGVTTITEIKDTVQGVKDCESGSSSTPDNGRSTCNQGNNQSSATSSNVSPCNVGQVRFNGQCIACTTHPAWVQFAKEARVYCPGGDTQGAPVVQQLQFCSAGARPNATLSGCECMYGKTTSKGLCESIKITKEQLKCGPNGCSVPKEQQCWTRNTPDSYKKCMGF